MPKRTFLACLALLNLFIVGAVTTSAAEPITPPGSRISLEPPKGFTVAATFAGFMDQANNASIVLIEFPLIAFDQIRNGVSAEAMAKHGMRFLSRETIDGLPYERPSTPSSASAIRSSTNG